MFLCCFYLEYISLDRTAWSRRYSKHLIKDVITLQMLATAEIMVLICNIIFSYIVYIYTVCDIYTLYMIYVKG